MADSFLYTPYTYNVNCLKQSILCQKKPAVHKTVSPARMERQTRRQTVPKQHSTHRQQLLHMKDSPYL